MKKLPSLLTTLTPWLTGSGIATGQAMLATACSVPKIGQCVGCGSCAVAVVALSGWALKNRRDQVCKQKEQGLEPFEIRTDGAHR